MNWEGPRTATRPVPGMQTAGNHTVQPASSGPNVGAIAGGTVGGVVALVALITIVLLCLRRRRRNKAPPHAQTEIDSNNKSELDGFQKSNVNYTASEGGTVVSSMTSTTAYSPQASPPYGTNSWSGSQHYYRGSPPHQGDEWAHQAAYPHQQTYYPPPHDPSCSPKYPHEISVELPDVRSPANAELSDVRSPMNAELPDLRSPRPLRAHGGL